MEWGSINSDFTSYHRQSSVIKDVTEYRDYWSFIELSGMLAWQQKYGSNDNFEGAMIHGMVYLNK